MEPDQPPLARFSGFGSYQLVGISNHILIKKDNKTALQAGSKDWLF
jgi:hypothetical protein